MKAGDNRRSKMRRPIVHSAFQERLDYNGLKAAWCTAIALQAKRQGLPARAASWEFPIVIGFWYWEPDRHRDPDNVAAGARKLILDGLVDAGVLPTDGAANIARFRADEFKYGFGDGAVSVGFFDAAETQLLATLLLPMRLPDLNELLDAREQAGRKAARHG